MDCRVLALLGEGKLTPSEPLRDSRLGGALTSSAEKETRADPLGVVDAVAGGETRADPMGADAVGGEEMRADPIGGGHRGAGTILALNRQPFLNQP